MFKLRKACRATALVAGMLALAGGLTFATGATTAYASGCTVINIGAPGNLNIGGVYAGQVEQQYDSCGHTRAHFQWSGNFYGNSNNYQDVNVGIYDAGPQPASSTNFGSSDVYGPQDVYSDWVDIHSSTPDTWQAYVTVPNCSQGGSGSWHAYANGANWGNSDGWC